MGASEQDRFIEIFDACSRSVQRYVRRHVERDHADEIVSETFLVAWRRLDDVPDEPLPWLLVVARNQIANHRRRLARRDQLQADLSALRDAIPLAPAAEDVVVGRAELFDALSALTALEREAVLLTAWDGLSDADAASVAGCSARAFRVRLHRARQRLERQLEQPARQTPAAPTSTSERDLIIEETP